MSPESISIAKDVIVSIAAIVTAGVAVFGVTSWRRELKGKTDFEVARQLMKATYTLRDNIAYAREPMILAYEFPEGYVGSLGDTSPEDNAKAYFHVFKNRWKPIFEALQEFDTSALEAEALWGDSIKSKTNEFRRSLSKLNAAKQMHIQHLRNGERNLDDDTAERIHRDLFDTTAAGTENELSEFINNAIGGIEEETRPHLKR